ncbi:MAG: hypothetical protein WC667_11860 [Sulfurimonas sp.]
MFLFKSLVRGILFGTCSKEKETYMTKVQLPSEAFMSVLKMD